MRRAGRAAQRDDDTARRARPCACIRRYNPEEPPIPAPPAPCYTCATIAPRLIFSWRSTTLICYVVPPKPPSPPLRYASTICLQICTFGRFLTAPGPRSISSMLALFGAAPPPKQPKPFPASPSADMHVLKLSASCERFPLSPPPLQVRVRGARRPASATSASAAATAAATTTTAEVSVGVGVARARADGAWRPAAAVSTSRLVVVVVSGQWSVVSGQWSVCVRSRRARDARVTRE